MWTMPAIRIFFSCNPTLPYSEMLHLKLQTSALAASPRQTLSTEGTRGRLQDWKRKAGLAPWFVVFLGDLCQLVVPASSTPAKLCPHDGKSCSYSSNIPFAEVWGTFSELRHTSSGGAEPSPQKSHFRIFRTLPPLFLCFLSCRGGMAAASGSCHLSYTFEFFLFSFNSQQFYT